MLVAILVVIKNKRQAFNKKYTHRGKAPQILILVPQVWPLCPPTKTQQTVRAQACDCREAFHRTPIHRHGHITGCRGATKGKVLRESSAAVPTTAVLLSQSPRTAQVSPLLGLVICGMRPTFHLEILPN